MSGAEAKVITDMRYQFLNTNVTRTLWTIFSLDLQFLQKFTTVTVLAYSP